MSLSPAKLLVILVIALIVLGPEKLPGVAHQLGAAWGQFRRWRAQLESEVRGVFPDLPATHEVAQAVRSPLAFLDRLADEHEQGTSKPGEDTAALPKGPDETQAGAGGQGAGAAANGNAASANGVSANGASANGAPATGPPPSSGDTPAFSQWSTIAGGDVADDPSMN